MVLACAWSAPGLRTRQDCPASPDLPAAGGLPPAPPARRGRLRRATALRGAGLLLALALVAVVLALAAALQSQPSVAVSERVGPQDVARALALLRQHDPRRATPGRAAVVALQARDVEIVLDHALQRGLRGASRVHLRKGAATLQLSVHLPPQVPGWLGRWLNVEIELAETGGVPALAAVRVGRLPLPPPVALALASALGRRAGLGDEMALLGEVVQQVRLLPSQVLLTYAWRSDSSARVLRAWLPEAEQRRLRVYAEHLALLAAREKPAWEVPMVRLLGPMFELARQRSAAGGDAAAENRAALLVLTLHANGRGLDSLLPEARAWRRARPSLLTLAGRTDFPMHFLVSALLAAVGDGPLSQAIGLYKELADARGGSGFSFTDLAANLAGTRLGEMAIHDAQRVQARLAQGVTEADLMPAAGDLPELLTEAEFVRRYGSVGSPAYQQLTAEIERRVAALPLFAR